MKRKKEAKMGVTQAWLYGGPHDGRVFAAIPRGHDGMPGPTEIGLDDEYSPKGYVSNYKLRQDRLTRNIGKLVYDYDGNKKIE